MAVDTDKLMRGMLLQNAMMNVGGALSSLGNRGFRQGRGFQPEPFDPMGIMQMQAMQEEAGRREAQRKAISDAAPQMLTGMAPERRAALEPILRAAPEMAAGPLLESLFREKKPPSISSLGGGFLARDGEVYHDPRLEAALLRQRQAGASRSTTNVNVQNTMDEEFAKKFPPAVVEQLSSTMNAGYAAVNQDGALSNLSNLITAGTPTGSLQPVITSLQGIASDVGVDLGKLADRLGVDLGNLASKEEVNRLSREVVIESMKKIEGNLNAQENKIALEANAGLGRSEEGNIKAIAAARAANTIARNRAAQAVAVRTPDQATVLMQSIYGGDGTEMSQLAAQYEQQMMGELQKTRAAAPSATTTAPAAGAGASDVEDLLNKYAPR